MIFIFEKLYHKLYYYDNYINSLNHHKDKENYKFSWIDNIGRHIVKEASFLINNKLIEKITSDWLIIWDELTLNLNKKKNIFIYLTLKIIIFNITQKKKIILPYFLI